MALLPNITVPLEPQMRRPVSNGSTGAVDIWFYPGETGWTVIFIVVNMSPQTSLNDVPVLRTLRKGAAGRSSHWRKQADDESDTTAAEQKHPMKKARGRLAWLSSVYFVL